MMMKLNITKNENIATYAKENFVTVKMIKINLNYIKKLEIIVTTQENLEMWLTIFAMRNSCSAS